MEDFELVCCKERFIRLARSLVVRFPKFAENRFLHRGIEGKSASSQYLMLGDEGSDHFATTDYSNIIIFSVRLKMR